MLKWLKPKPVVLRSEELQQVTELLFPPLETVERGEDLVFQVDYSVDSNLQSALYDLEEGRNGIMCYFQELICRLCFRRYLQFFQKINI